MDSDPEDGHYIVAQVLDVSALLLAVDGIRQKKED